MKAETINLILGAMVAMAFLVNYVRERKDSQKKTLLELNIDRLRETQKYAAKEKAFTLEVESSRRANEMQSDLIKLESKMAGYSNLQIFWGVVAVLAALIAIF